MSGTNYKLLNVLQVCVYPSLNSDLLFGLGGVVYRHVVSYNRGSVQGGEDRLFYRYTLLPHVI